MVNLMSKGKIPDLPKINLSKYNNPELRLPSKIETIIVQTIIHYNGNVSRASKTLTIDEDIINQVYMTYYFQIAGIIKSKERDIDSTSTIETALKIYQRHINEIDKSQSGANFKMLNNNTRNSLNTTVDRILQLQKNNAEKFDKLNNTLINQIQHYSSIGLSEFGRIEDDQQYQANQQVLLQELAKSYAANNKNILPQHEINELGQYPRKKLFVTNVETGESYRFNSRADFGRFLGTNVGGTITKCIEAKKLYIPTKGNYKGKKFLLLYEDELLKESEKVEAQEE